MWHESSPDYPESPLGKVERKAPPRRTHTGAGVEEPADDRYDYLENSASTDDMTGLIPAAVRNEAQAEAYEDIYEYLPPAAAARRK